MEDEVVNIEIDSFDKLSIVDFGIVGKKCKIKQINANGVFLIIPPSN